jgi:hypothetical protein
VQLAYWQNWVRTGKKDIPMNKLPFTLVCARVLDEDGNPVFKRDLWRLAIGERRRELSH